MQTFCTKSCKDARGGQLRSGRISKLANSSLVRKLAKLPAGKILWIGPRTGDTFEGLALGGWGTGHLRGHMGNDKAWTGAKWPVSGLSGFGSCIRHCSQGEPHGTTGLATTLTRYRQTCNHGGICRWSPPDAGANHAGAQRGREEKASGRAVLVPSAFRFPRGLQLFERVLFTNLIHR